MSVFRCKHREIEALAVEVSCADCRREAKAAGRRGSALEGLMERVEETPNEKEAEMAGTTKATPAKAAAKKTTKTAAKRPPATKKAPPGGVHGKDTAAAKKKAATSKPVAKAKAPKKDHALEEHGARRRRKARSSGSTIALYDVREATSKPVTVDGKPIALKAPTAKEVWAVVCETHGTVAYFETWNGTMDARKNPESFCSGCADAVKAKASK